MEDEGKKSEQLSEGNGSRGVCGLCLWDGMVSVFCIQ